MKCKICGRSGQFHVLSLSLSGGDTRNDVCQACKLKQSLKSFKSLEELDQFEADYFDLEKQLKRTIQAIPEPMEAPKAFEGLALTPMSMYKHVQEVLAEIKVRKMEMLMEEDSEFRIRYLLKIAIEEEEFEQASVLQKQLDELQK